MRWGARRIYEKGFPADDPGVTTYGFEAIEVAGGRGGPGETQEIQQAHDLPPKRRPI